VSSLISIEKERFLKNHKCRSLAFAAQIIQIDVTFKYDCLYNSLVVVLLNQIKSFIFESRLHGLQSIDKNNIRNKKRVPEGQGDTATGLVPQ